MQKFTQYILIVSAILLSLNVNAQLLAPYSDFSDAVNASDPAGPDSMFVFNFDNDSTFIIVDTQNYQGYSIQWEEYQPGVGFVPVATTSEKIYVTTDSIAKGYRVILTNGPAVDSMNCWVVKNDFVMEIVSKVLGLGDTLWVNSYATCGSIEQIKEIFKEATIKYFNSSNDTLYYSLNYSNEWKKELETDGVGNVSLYTYDEEEFIYRIANSYWEGMWYTHIITDEAQLEKRDSVYVRSITPKAEFPKPEAIRLDDSVFYPDRSEAYYSAYGTEYYSSLVEESSAPAKYRFISSESKNAHRYLWHFGDTAKNLKTNKDTIFHTYNYWGEFEPYLVAYHSAGFINNVCEDTARLENPIEIDEPHLLAPNAFSPPAGMNPIWRFSDVSITDFEIAIYNRNGLKVHSFKGNIRDWEGWDGRYRNASNVVPTGVYFYIVKKYNVSPNIDSDLNMDIEWKGTGDNTQYRGFIHLFNTEQ